MTYICLALFALFALANWLAAYSANSRLEHTAKPAAMAALILFAAAVGPLPPALLAALLFCLVGDVYLMLPDDHFIHGLAAFLAGQLAFTVAFAQPWAGSLAWGAVVLFATLPVTVRVLSSVASSALRAGIVAYMAAICLMAGSAMATGSVLAGAGAVLFVLSDSLLAWDRFVKPVKHGHFMVMVTYHLAMFLLTLSFCAA